jgi:hypothetical protein
MPGRMIQSRRARRSDNVTELTRRRDRDRSDDHWQIFYGDVQVGTIGKRAGVPLSVDQWGWSCGFQPATNRGISAGGTAADFDRARAAFEHAWQTILPRCTEDDFTGFRRQRALTQWKYKMWETGKKVPTQCTTGQSTCYCGAPIDIAGTEPHIYAAHLNEETETS